MAPWLWALLVLRLVLLQLVLVVFLQESLSVSVEVSVAFGALLHGSLCAFSPVRFVDLNDSMRGWPTSKLVAFISNLR